MMQQGPYYFAGGGGYTDEQARDVVAAMLTDSATIDFTYDDAANTVTAIVKASSVDVAVHLVYSQASRLAGRGPTGTATEISVGGGIVFSGSQIEVASHGISYARFVAATARSVVAASAAGDFGEYAISADVYSLLGYANNAAILSGIGADAKYVDVAGDTMTGTLSQVIAGGGAAFFFVQGEGATIFQAARYSANNAAAAVTLSKARGTIASPGAVVTNDLVFSLLGQGWETTTPSFRTAVQLSGAVIAATPSNTDMQGRWQFFASPAGSVTPTEIMRLDHTSGLGMFGANIIVDANRVFRNRIYTVATLPAGTNGMRTFVSDALGPAWGVAVTGGGAVVTPVYYNGAWTVG